jgi:hypothetical protein
VTITFKDDYTSEKKHSYRHSGYKGTVYFVQQNDGMLVGANSEHKQFVIPVLGSPDKVGYSDDHDAWFVVEEYGLRAIINNM